MKIAKISSLLDHASVLFQEDGVMVSTTSPHIIAVCDAYSVPYDKNNPPILVPGGSKMSTGEMVKSIFTGTIPSAAFEGLRETIKKINYKIRLFHSQLQVKLEEPAYFAGLSCVVLKISNTSIKVFQCGDCLALWKNKDGSIEYTENPAKSASLENRSILTRFLLEENGDYEAARVRFTPLLMQQKSATSIEFIQV